MSDRISTFPGRLDASPVSRAASSSRRTPAKTEKPRCASPTAVAWPMPVDVPVMRTA